MVKEQTSRKYSLLPPPVVLLILGFTLVVIILYALESQAMFGFFKRTEVQLSPPVKGRITNHGNPLASVEVVRKIFYSGYDKENAVIDYALTNTHGEFSFNEKIIKSSSPGNIFGENIPVSQEIYIKKDKNERKDEEDNYYWLWLTSKHWKSFPLLNALMLQLDADLQNKEVQHEINLTQFSGLKDQPIISICYWENDLITTYYNGNMVNNYNEIN